MWLPGMLLLAIIIGCLTATSSARATVVSVTDATSTFNVVNPTWTLSDAADDAQTGDKYADFVSTQSSPGFYIKFGQIDGTDMLVFRFIMEDYNANKGFTGTLRLGMDADGDGDIDLFFGPSISNGNNSQTGIYVQDPGTGLNNSPSSTTIGNNYAETAVTSSNYNYIELADGTAQLTFAVSFTTIQDALSALGITITTDSFVRFIAFTSQQATSNSINQDILGITGNITSTVSFSDLGAFSDYINSNGSPVPELGGMTYAGALVLAGIFWRGRRPRKESPAKAA